MNVTRLIYTCTPFVAILLILAWREKARRGHDIEALSMCAFVAIVAAILALLLLQPLFFKPLQGFQLGFNLGVGLLPLAAWLAGVRVVMRFKPAEPPELPLGLTPAES